MSQPNDYDSTNPGTPSPDRTPRTDAALRALVLVGIKYGFSEGLLHDLAKDSRQLERENAALVKERDALIRDKETFQRRLERALQTIDELNE